MAGIDFEQLYSDGEYDARFPPRSKVKIADHDVLCDFIRSWKYHHKLVAEQLEHSGKVVEVEDYGIYYGGGVVYELKGVPGSWHQFLLSSAE